MSQEELKSAKTLGIVSLIAAFLIPLVGVICGHISLSKYKKLAGPTDGKGIAKAGLIISYIFIALTIIYIIVAAVFVSSNPELLQGLESIPTE